MKKTLVLIAAMALIAGCGTLSNITTYDKDGKIVSVESVDADVIGSVMQSTKNKTVIVWKSGWAAYISASMSTTDDPTPTGKIFAGKVDAGYISVCKEQQNINWDGIARVVEATNKSLNVTMSGVGETVTPATATAVPEAR